MAIINQLSKEFLLTVFAISFAHNHVMSTSIVPAQPIALARSAIVLKCPVPQPNYHGAQPTWSVQYLDGAICTVSRSSVSSACNRAASHIVQYGQESLNGLTVSSLKILSTSLSDAGVYTCTFGTQWGQQLTASVNLVVLASAPSVQSTPEYVTHGQNLTYSCNVAYNGSSVLKILWTNSSTKVPIVPPGGRLSSDESHISLMRLESNLTITVAKDISVVPPHTCSVVATTTSSDTQASGNDKTYSTDSRAIVLTYCPRNVAIMSTDNGLVKGSQLICQADAHPPAEYRWFAIGANGRVSGEGNSTLTVTSLANDVIEFRCTAVNFLRGDQRPCYASATITECANNGFDSSPNGQSQSSSVKLSPSAEQLFTNIPSTATAYVQSEFVSTSTAYDRVTSESTSFSFGQSNKVDQLASIQLTNLTSTDLPIVDSVKHMSSSTIAPTSFMRKIHSSTESKLVPVTAAVDRSSSTSRSVEFVNSVDWLLSSFDGVLTTRTSSVIVPGVRRAPTVITAVTSRIIGPESLLNNGSGNQRTAIWVLSVLMAAVIVTLVVIGVVLARIIKLINRYQDNTTLTLLDRTNSPFRSQASVTTDMTSLTVACSTDM